MDVYRLKDLSQEERQTVLVGESITAEEQVYMKTLTPEELHVMREEMANASILLNEYEAEFKETKEAYKSKVTPIRQKRDESLSAIRLKAIPITGKVWVLADHENKMMHSVTDEGSVLASRPMLPEERQYRIPSTLNKAM
jgi:hypothetical protein